MPCTGKKRHLNRMALSNGTGFDTVAECQLVPQRAEQTGLQGTTISTVRNLPIFYLLLCPGLRDMAMEFLQRASKDWSLHVTRLQDLPTLTRLNSFDALARNALVLGIPVECLESDDGGSPFTFQGPQPPNSAPPTFPAHLSPTHLQKTVRHHPWLDLFPFPQMRDNILRGIDSGEIDEDRLCNELVCDFLNLETSSNASLIIWGDSWDMDGWEFSPHFFMKWRTLLRGCPEVLQATNYWRKKRKVTALELVLD